MTVRRLLLLLGAVLWPDAGRAALVCDGRTDPTAALRTLLAAGGTVALPAGTCVVSGTLVIPSHSVVAGAGVGVTVIRATPGLFGPVISVGGRTLATGSTDVDLSGLTVDGGATAVNARGSERSDGIRVPFGSTRVRIHDLEVQHAAANGIEVNGSDNVVADNSVHDNYANGIYVIGKGNKGGLNVVPARGVLVQNNRVSHNSLGKQPGSGHAWDGIDIDPITEGAVVEGNTVVGNDIILFENGDVVAYSSGHRVIGNTVRDSPGNGVVVEGPQQDFLIEGNRIERTVGWGIVANGPSRRGVVRGNTVGSTTLEGILIKNTTPQAGAPQDIAVVENTVGPSGPKRAAIAARHGARVRVFGNAAASVDIRQAAPDAEARDNR